MFKKTRLIKRWYRRNRARILYTTVTVLGLTAYMQNRGIKQHDQFLIEKDLYHEYHFPQD